MALVLYTLRFGGVVIYFCITLKSFNLETLCIEILQ